MSEIFGFDAYSPKEIAERVESIGVAKVAGLPPLSSRPLASWRADSLASARFIIR